MNKFVYKLATAASSAALVLGSFGPATYGATNITINGNGADSDNEVEFSQTNTTSVTQTNTANITNNVTADASTGDNDANRNTGGDVTVDTGDATSTVAVSNTANANVANVESCCVSDVNLTISGNGADSDNDIDIAGSQGIANTVVVTQTNDADVENNVSADASTGNNDANRNTGGDVEITTGDANSNVSIANQLNANWVTVGGNGDGGSIDIEISGNGADSDNEVELDLDNTVFATQRNNANVQNNVSADASTGNNDANRNTGGDVSIDTGDASVDVDILNLANFNGADLSGCDCEMDVDVKVAGNGDDSDNDVDLELDSVLGAVQTNDFDCGGSNHGWPWFFDWLHDEEDGSCADVDADASTGGNDTNRNTGEVDGDPSVSTGDASSDVEVTNEVNSNVFGDVDFDLPDFDLDFDGFVFWMIAHMSS